MCLNFSNCIAVMSFITLPFFFFTLVAVSHGVEWYTYDQIPGDYVIRRPTPGCPTNITIPSTAQASPDWTNPFKIPYNRIIVDGTPCGGYGYLDTWAASTNIFRNSSFFSSVNQSKSMKWFLDQCIVPWARYQGTQCWFARTISSFSAMQCGNFTFREESLQVFLAAPSTLTHPTLGVLNTQTLVLLDGPCVYSADRFAAESSPQSDNNNTNGDASTATAKSPARKTTAQRPACFPGDATAELNNGTFVPMRSLKVGDVVRVGRGRFDYSKVFLFTHRIAAVSSRFVRIFLRDGRTLRVSGGHYVYINGPRKLVPGRAVRVGDYMDDSLVIRTESILEEGLYNPQTPYGDIVVDHVLVSTYTEAMEPWAAHALLSALRCMVRVRLYSSSMTYAVNAVD